MGGHGLNWSGSGWGWLAVWIQ